MECHFNSIIAKLLPGAVKSKNLYELLNYLIAEDQEERGSWLPVTNRREGGCLRIFGSMLELELWRDCAGKP